MDPEHTLHIATNLAVAMSNKMYSSYSNQRKNSNVLRLTPPGFKHPIDVQFPPRCLPVCGRCKKNFKTREHCRGRDCHTDLPWCDTYVCVSLDKSCTDENGKLLDGPFVAKVIPPVDFTFKEQGELDPLTPICAPCKDKNYTRTYCRQHKNHRQLPWSTVYVIVSLDPSSCYYERAVVPAESSCTSVPSMIADADEEPSSEDLHDKNKRRKTNHHDGEAVGKSSSSLLPAEVNEDAQLLQVRNVPAATTPPIVVVTATNNSCFSPTTVQQEHHQHQPTTKRAGSAPPPEEQESDDEEVVVVAVTAVEHGSDDADASRDQHSSSSTSKASSITRDINNKKREHEEESQAPTSTSPGASTSTASTVNKNYSETLWNNVPRSRTFLATVSADAKRIEWVDIDPMLQCQLPFYREINRHSINPSSYYSRQEQYPPSLCFSSSSRGGDDGPPAMFCSSSSARGYQAMMHKYKNCSTTTITSNQWGASRSLMNNTMNSCTTGDGGSMFDHTGAGYNNMYNMTASNDSSSKGHNQKQNYQNDSWYHSVGSSHSRASPSTHMPYNMPSSYDYNDNVGNGCCYPSDFYKTASPHMENMMHHRGYAGGRHGSMGGRGIGNRYPDRMQDMRMSSQMQQMGGPIPYHTPSSSMYYPSDMEYGDHSVRGGSGFHHQHESMMQPHEDMNYVGEDDHFPQRGFDRSQMMNNMSAFKPVGAGKMNPGGW